MSGTVGWNYGLMATSEDKKASKVAVRSPFSYELRNVDGSTEGPCRPFPGFKEVYSFVNPTTLGVLYGATSEVVEVQPFQITVGTTGYAYGFVYRMQKVGGTDGPTACGLFVDYWQSNGFNWGTGLYDGAWVRGQELLADVPLPPHLDTTDGRLMSVSAYGKFLYVFVEGSSAVSFFLQEVELLPGTYTQVVTTPLGPKKRPTLLSPDKAGVLGATDPPAASRAGTGQIVLLAYLPDEIGLMTGTYPSGSDSGSGVPPGRQVNEDINYLEPGDYAFACQFYDSRSGRRSALSDIAQARTTEFDPDSSGALSATSLYAAIEVSYDSTRYDQLYVYRSVKVQDAGGTYVAGILHLDKIINLNEYLTVNTATGSFAGDADQSIYYYELEDKQLVFQETFDDLVLFDEEVPKAGASIWYDGTMILGAIRDAQASTSDENRRDDLPRSLSDIRYSSLLYDSAELFPPGNRYVPSQSASPILRFVQAGPHVIGFSKDRQFHFRKSGSFIKPEEMHDGFGLTGAWAVDVVGSAAYFLTTKGLKTVDAMGQLEDVRAFNELILERWSLDLDECSVAYDPLVSCLLIHNPVKYETAVLWFNSSMASEISDTRFLQVVRGVWPSAVSGYLWSVFSGNANDATITGWNTPLIQRAFFLEKAPKLLPDDPVGSPIWRQRLFVIDTKREKSQSGGSNDGEDRRSMLPFDSDSIFKVHTTYNGSSSRIIELKTGPTGTPYTTDHVCSQDIWNCKLYVLWATNPALIGESAYVTYRIGSNSTRATVQLGEDYTNLYGLVEGDIVGVSPVPFRWIGHPLAAAEVAASGDATSLDNFFQLRHVNAITCSFVDVEGTHTTSEHANECRFTGHLYRGSDAEPTARAFARDRNNERVRSIHDDETPNVTGFAELTGRPGRHGFGALSITPGIEILCPDVDYRLVAVKVTGSLVESTSSKRTQ